MRRGIIGILLIVSAIFALAALSLRASGDENYKLRVAEQDGSPVAYNVKQIKVPNGSLTDNSGGTVSLAFTNMSASNLTSGTVSTALLSEDVARTATVTLAASDVLALHSTPFVLVAAPGAGKVVLIDEITVKLVFNSAAYTGTNAMEFRYTDGSGAKVTADMANTFLNSSSGTNYQSVKGVTTALTPVANAPVVLVVPTANPAAGNSPLGIKVKYRIVTP